MKVMRVTVAKARETDGHAEYLAYLDRKAAVNLYAYAGKFVPDLLVEAISCLERINFSLQKADGTVFRVSGRLRFIKYLGQRADQFQPDIDAGTSFLADNDILSYLCPKVKHSHADCRHGGGD